MFTLHHLLRRGRNGIMALFDAALPPRCLLCGTVVVDDSGLCPTCFMSLSFLESSLCPCCGLPARLGHGTIPCPACQHSRPAYDAARSVLIYDDISRPLLLRFKHGDRSDFAPAFARWMARAGADFLAQCDVIVPVPLHWRRLLLRRYNQAALLARRLGPGRYLPHTLIRTRWTVSQGSFDHRTHARNKRYGNVAGVFSVRHPHAIQGKRVLLIDDVMTTGATVEECARVLRAAGARSVMVLTLARALPKGH